MVASTPDSQHGRVATGVNKVFDPVPPLERTIRISKSGVEVRSFMVSSYISPSALGVREVCMHGSPTRLARLKIISSPKRHAPGLPISCYNGEHLFIPAV